MQALAMLSSDALSSIAYGPEQVILSFSQSLSSRYLVEPLSVFLSSYPRRCLTISYRQIIHAYPQGGGALYGHWENSPELGLIAGGSLLVDYMLTVAVSVASGADAITAAIPALHPYNLHISIFLSLPAHALEFKRIEESASSLMIPVYLFIFSTVFLLLYGFFSTIHRFPKLSGDFNHWANRSESFHRSPIESLYQWLCLSDRGLLFQMRYHFSKLRKKRMLLRP